VEWLSGWLKSIILIILLAAFADLLLPSQKMQRYVKTVLSLFILLTLITPVFELFNKDWNPDRLIAAAEAKQQPGRERAMASLQEIQQNADRMQQEQRTQAQELVQQQLGEGMKRDVERDGQVAVDSILVQTDFDHNGNPFISNVRIALHAIDHSGSDKAGSNKKQGVQTKQMNVVPVVPVQIDLESNKKLSNGSVSATTESQVQDQSATTDNAVLKGHIRNVENMLQRVWLVDPGRIDVQVTGLKTKF
jgi:stage III sporulation protein AF